MGAYEPKVELTKIYDSTCYDGDETVAMYGAKVTTVNDQGEEVAGSLSTEQIWSSLEQSMTENNVAPNQVLYVDLSGLNNVVATDKITFENAIYRRVRDGLLSIPDIRVFLPSAEKGNTLLFTSGRRSASAIAAELAEHGICTRSGMHCSPFAHKTLGTGGDAVRASFSVFNTPDEADRFLFAVEKANASG